MPQCLAQVLWVGKPIKSIRMQYLISVTPIVLLFVLMLRFKISGHASALLTLAATIILAMFAAPTADIVPETYDDYPISNLIGIGIVEGILKAIFPIFLIILMAIFSYNILVESKQIEVIKRQFISLTDDKGILVLLMVWGFGGLLEGMAGFGTAVAIPAAILIGLGFKPFFSALVALLGNTVATGFAAVGVPVTTLCNEASIGGHASAEMIREVSAFTVIQLSPLFFLVPFVILYLTDKTAWKKNFLLTLWVGGVSLVVQFLCAYYLGAETPAIIGSIAAIIALIIAARVDDNQKVSGVKFFQALKSWSVYIIILVLILLTGSMMPEVNTFLKGHLVSTIELPIIQTTFRFGWISNAAFVIFVGSVIGGIIQGLSIKQLAILLCKTLFALRYTALTIISLITMASVMNYSGMISTIAIGLVSLTGDLYPLFAPLIGAIGTFVTGSDTSSNILFAKLQVNVAHNLGMSGNANFLGINGSESNWLLAANTTGATGGKMISPQSIAIATAACEMTGSDSKILRKAIPFAIAYVLIGGIIIYFG